MTITEKELQEWQAQCDEADPPPWDCAHGYEYSRRHPPQVGLPTANTRFANTARTAVPRLIAEVERLRDKIAQFIHGEDHPDQYVTQEEAMQLRTRAKRTNYEVFGLRVDVAAWRETSSRHQKNAERAEAALREAGKRVIEHHIRGKDKTTAGYYTAVTGREVMGVDIRKARKALQQTTDEEEKDGWRRRMDEQCDVCGEYKILVRCNGCGKVLCIDCAEECPWCETTDEEG